MKAHFVPTLNLKHFRSYKTVSLIVAALLAATILTTTAYMQSPQQAHQTNSTPVPIPQEKEIIPVMTAQASGAEREAPEAPSSMVPAGPDLRHVGDYPLTYQYPSVARTMKSVLPTLNVPNAPLAGLTGTKNVPGDYATLALAITDLNTNGVGAGGVIFNVTAAQTAPAGGYVIGGAGSLVLTSSSAANQITFTGNGNTITAPNPQTVGNLNDGIVKLIGADFVTIQGFTLQENPLNTTSATGATNNMTEWGIALLYVSLTDGSQNNTIQNNTISLNRTYLNTFGIYSNTRHSSTAVTTSAEVAAATGSNSANKVYGNSISNVNYGIVFVGAGTTIAAIDNGNDIGGTTAATGNTITNWGGGSALTSYVSLTGSNYCIYDNQQINDNVSFNTITSAALTQSVTTGGFLKAYTIGSPTSGTIATTINNNTVTVTNNPTATTTGGIVGLNNQGLTPLLATATMSMNNNTVQNCVLGGSTSTTNGITAITNLSLPGTMNMTGNNVINNSITATTATTGIIAGISNSGAAGTVNINTNIIRGLASSSTSGQVQTISNTGAVVTALNINNNQLGNASGGLFSTSTATSGTLFGIVTSGGAGTCALSIQTNDIRGITYNVAASAAQAYYQNSATTLSQNISSNTFTNLNVNTTGGVTFISDSVSLTSTGAKNINSNQIVTAFNKGGVGGTVTLYNDGASSVNGSTVNNNNNNFSNITITGATAFAGWFNQDGLSSSSSATKTITGNTFSNITGGSSTVTALQINFSGPTTATGNTISNITGTGSIIGLSIGSSNGQGTHTYSSNTITNLTSNSPGAGVNGIQGGSASIVTLNVGSNTITGLSQTGSASQINPIIITAGPTVNIFKNKIANIQSDNAGATINGIAVTAGTTFNIYNNLVGDLRLPSANAASPLVGILLNAPTTANVYYNTVNLNASSSGAVFGSAAIFSSTTTTTTLRNNVFVNTSIPKTTGLTVAYLRGNATLTTYGATSNNNDFYAGTPGTNNLIFSDGTNSDQTLAAYKTRVGPTRDAASVSDLPPLNTTPASPQFLHVTSTTGSGIINGGAAIPGFTDDYDGDTRDASTPDMGADEVTSLQFSAATYSVAENVGGGTVTISVTRTANTGNAATVQYATSDGSATGGATCTGSTDYVNASGTLNFAAGDTSKTFNVTICPDTTVENNETVNLTLSNATGSILGSPNTAQLTITNDDFADTDVGVSGGNLVITDANGGTTADTLTISLNGANVRINDPSHTLTAGAGAVQVDANTVEVPLASISGNIQVNTLGGNDTLTLNFAGGNFLPAGGLSYDGGSQTSTPGDKLVISGGSQGTVTYNYTNAHDGNIVLSNFGTVTYTGLEPISNSGTATDVIVNLPAGPSAATLADDGTAGNTMSRLSAATIETTDFSNPTGSLTINRGNSADTLAVNGLPDFNASLTIGSSGNPFSGINFFGTTTLASGKNLIADASVTILGLSPVISTSGSGAITLTAGRSISTGTGTSFNVVDGNLTFNANTAGTTTGNFLGINADGTFTTSGTGNIVFTGKGGSVSGPGNRYGIFMLNGALIRSTSAAAGAGTIMLNGTGGPGGQLNVGVEIFDTGTAVTSVSGDISITGQGGAGSNNSNIGVQLQSGAAVRSTGAAKITINGTGGTSGIANSRGIGVRISDDSSQVTSSGGDILITGQGANGGSSNYGVSIAFGGFVGATGGAKITMDGTGGSGTDSLSGVIISRFDATTNAPSRVTSDSGDIAITGNAGNGTSLGNIGINTDTSARIVATGPANVTMIGTGGNGTSDCYGVGFEGNDKAGTGVSAVNGNISITGTGGTTAGTDMDGVRFEDSNTAQAVAVTTTGTGTLTINGTAGNSDPTSAGINIVDDCTMSLTGATNMFIADTMDFGTSNVSINAGANTLTLQQKTNGKAINLGGADSPTQLGLTDVELDLITAATLNLGDSNSGAITVSSSISRTAATTLNLVSGANIDIAGGSLDSNGGNITVTPATNVFPSNSGVDVTTSGASTLNLTSGRDLKISIVNTTVDSGYTQLNVAGLVNLNGANLSFAGSTYAPVGGESFIIVKNDSTDPITGTFANGPTFTNFLGSGLTATISYTGGDGNDAELTVASAPTISINNTSLSEGGGNMIFTVTRSATSGTNTTFLYSTADGTATAGSDYTGATNVPGMITAGNTTTTISIPISPDALYEGNETFTVTLSNPANATIATGTGTGTILDDDAAPANLAVNTTADHDDGFCTPLAPGNDCTLREAINAANSNTVDANTIAFNIPLADPGFAGGVFKIAPLSALPAIVGADTVVDGTTQTAFTGNTNTAGPEVYLSGINVSGPLTFVDGLTLKSFGGVVRGLIISGFTTGGFANRGIHITGASAGSNKVEACYLGTDPTGTSSVSNGMGITIDGGAAFNTIGGATAGQGNLISGNTSVVGCGIYINGGQGNMVLGNLIGTTADGTADLGNGAAGVMIENSNSNQIGGSTVPERNVISGSAFMGVQITGASAVSNQVSGNYIGTNASGTAAIANAGAGVIISDGANGNSIGIGGPNVISGNTDGVVITGAGSSSNTVSSNFIGTDAAGTASVGNTQTGVTISGFATNNTIGGAANGTGNVISGNTGSFNVPAGIKIQDSGTTGNVVQGNFIGVEADGSTALANTCQVAGGCAGLLITDGANGNTIGGTTGGGQRNIIANNSGDGIQVSDGSQPSGTAVNNSLRGNSIYSNGKLGINLIASGENPTLGLVTANDAGDGDSGPNTLQNFPQLFSATVTGSTHTITGNLNSTPSQMFTLEFFNNAACDGSNGEGRTYIGSLPVTTDGGGNVFFTFNPATLSAGDVITATATDSNGNTSEFSQCKSVASGTAGDIKFVSATYSVAENGGPAAITIKRIGGSSGSISATFNTSDGTATTADNDYTPVNNFFVTFADGDTTDKIVNIPINDDGTYEFNETVNLILSATSVNRPSSPESSVGDSAVLTITNDDPVPADATFVVNTNDDNDFGACLAEHCSLREAINAANANSDASTINFAIPGGGVQTITPTSPLPFITQPAVIDGYTQGTAHPNTLTTGTDAVLLIQLDGVSAGVTSGLRLSSSGSTIKGLSITRFGEAGLALTAGNTVRGNYIGVDATGLNAAGNTIIGVYMDGANNVVGGTSVGDRNVISGNLETGVRIVGATAQGNQVIGNLIGTDATGSLDLGNNVSGVALQGGASANQIGGTTAAARNVISGNGNGIDISDDGSANNIVQGNYIGTAVDGVTALANSGHGIFIIGNVGTSGNIIGGSAAGAGNMIANNGGAGISLVAPGAVNNSLRGNSIFANNTLGIDLNGDGITANDAGDVDQGPNNLQNFPQLLSASVTGSTKTITGNLNSTPSQTFTLDFYNNPACDGSNGEGKTYIGSLTTGTTDGSGNVFFTFHPATLSPGDIITATATDSNGNTSEFSQCKPVAAGVAGDIQFTSATYTVSEGGGTAAITVERVGGSQGAITANFSTSNGSATEPGDYLAATNFPISYADGETGQKTVNVTINEDSTYEGDETVNLSLDTTVVLRPQRINTPNDINPHAATLTITDNDLPSISGHLNYRDTAIGAPNIVMTLTGNNGFVTRTTNSDVNGDYTFANVTTGNDYTVTPSRVPEPHDPSITAFDASQAARFDVQLISLTPNQQTAGDSSNNGQVTAFDASQIARYDVSIPTPASIAGSWKFTPGSLSINNLSGNQANQNLTAILVGDITGDWTPHGPGRVGAEAATSSPSGTAITVSLPVKQDPPGGVSTIPINVGNTTGQGIGSYALDISFDQNVLLPQGTPYDTAGTLSSGWLITPNTSTPGHLILNGFSTTDMTGQGVMLKLKFDVVGGQGSTTPLTFVSFNFNEGNPADNDINGTFTATAPTAALAAISGQIVDAASQPVSGVTVTVLGGSHTIRAITDNHGFYKVENLEVGGFYTVTPSRANYQFAPANRSFSLVGNKTDAVFTGIGIEPEGNPLESPEFFVRQQYLDFLGREPEQSGLDYWSGQLRACDNNPDCINTRRLDISAAFFIAQEFQDSGLYIYDVYEGALGRRPDHAQYAGDRSSVVGGPQLETDKVAFARGFVERAEFQAQYPLTMNDEVFVDALLRTAQQSSGLDLSRNRAGLLTLYNSGSTITESRSLVLRSVVEGTAFKQTQYNAAFVLMEYYGYLGRNPDREGYDFWLQVLNDGDRNNYRGMVCSFITSAEYQQRFSPVATHSNVECGRIAAARPSRWPSKR